MEMNYDKSLKVREGLRTAGLAVLLVGAFLDLLLVVMDTDISPFIAVLISMVLAALLLSRPIPVKYFTWELKEVNARSFFLWLSRIAVIAAFASISSVFLELLQAHIWMTSALALFFILQFAGLIVGYISRR